MHASLKISAALLVNFAFLCHEVSLLLSKCGQPEDIIGRLKKQIEAEPSIEITSSTVTRIAAETKVSIEMTFKDGCKAMEFMNSISEGIKFENHAPPLVEKVLIGELDLTLDIPNYHFIRTLDFRQFNTTEMTPTFARTPLADATFESTIHLPTHADSHNATSESYGGKTLHWKMPLIEMLEGTKKLKHTAKIPIPQWALFLSIMTAVCLLGLAIRFISKLVRRRKKKSTFSSSSPSAAP